MSDSNARKPPRWVAPFLSALERTGKVREAAKWAGVDFTTAYARRKAHSDFAAGWEAALARFRAEQARIEEEAVVALEKVAPSPGSPLASPTSPAEGRGALQEKRVNSARWTDAKERRFFDELVATANVRRAAEAAGVSVQAVYARRAKHAVFRLRWAKAIENGRAAIETHLIAQAQRSMDPETMDLPAPEPRVSVSEAIKIAQMNQAAGGRGRGAESGFDSDAAEVSDEQKEELRARLQRKIEALRARMVADDGWFLDEATGHLIPPGWIRDPDYAPKEAGD